MAKYMNRRVMGLVKRRLLSSSGLPASVSYPSLAGAALLLSVAPHAAQAYNLYNNAQSGGDLVVNLTTTLEYSLFERVNNPSKILTGPANANGSEGDLAFQHGIVANEIEALPVLDIRDGDFGLHASGEFYLNTPYLSKNQNDQPSTFNPFTPGSNKDFTSATRNVNGQDARLLDAFAFGQHTFADGQNISLKVGRSTLFWGQSLLLYSDSIAGGQAPVDVITAQSLPNAQAQQVFLPVGQAIVTYQPLQGTGLTFQGYYQFEWQHDNFQGVGAYFNTADILDKGGQRLILDPPGTLGPGTPGVYAYRTNDLNPPSQNGQFGISVQGPVGNFDLGLYALRFDSKTPVVYLTPTGGVAPAQKGLSAGSYTLVYPRDIAIYGASASTNVGNANVAGELSGRTNQPLLSGEGISVGVPSASSGALYAVGDTIQAQGSVIYLTAGLPGIPGGVSFTGEVEMNHLVSVTKNRSALDTGRQATSGTSAFVITPMYNDVLPNLDITFPIGLSYNFLGRSEIDPSINHGTGGFNLGISAVYNTVWTGAITYVDYLGRPSTSYVGGGNSLADRGYVEFNLQRTF